MKKLEINEYANFLDLLHLKSYEIYGIIEKYNLEFLQFKNNKVEWGMGFPMFLTPFYKYIYLNRTIPQQNEFYKYYLNENAAYFETKNYNKDIVEGLKARIYRTYPSLVRDIHFSQYVKENFKDGLIIYNRKLDVEEGIDLLIVYNSKNWGINLYTDTRRAHVGREKKVFRHTKFDNVNYVELPVDFKGSVICGKFFLYGEKECNQIQAIIRN